MMETTTRKKKLNRRKLESSDEEDEQPQPVVKNPETDHAEEVPDDLSDDIDYSKLSNGEIEAQLRAMEDNINKLEKVEAD
mmetsp:Transcript_1385/g.1893  ORF Transcript_1385/g.1893 Transcript_1385/m.1893 type:complete len:80 (+) Transcript_1385:19-258(+)